jgi:predicted metalloprotease with PDZ domain
MYDECYVKAPNASYYLRGRGYTQADFVRVLSSIAGTDMRGFYDRYIGGVEPLPYDDAFAGVGLKLSKSPTESFSLGFDPDMRSGTNLRIGSIRTGSPAQRAGLQEGDVIPSIAGAPVTRQNWRAALDRYRAGDRVTFQVRRFAQIFDRTVELGPPMAYGYRLDEIPNAPAEAKRLREAWLNGQ